MDHGTPIRYASAGGVNIAYRVIGEGPLDVVWVPSLSNLERDFEAAAFDRLMQRLASFSRLMLFDMRGMGLSDRNVGAPTLEERMDDVRAVMDAVGSDRAALIGFSEGGPMSILFAATYPQRTVALVLYGTTARARADVELLPERLRELIGLTARMHARVIHLDGLISDDRPTPVTRDSPVALQQWLIRSAFNEE